MVEEASETAHRFCWNSFVSSIGVRYFLSKGFREFIFVLLFFPSIFRILCADRLLSARVISLTHLCSFLQQQSGSLIILARSRSFNASSRYISTLSGSLMYNDANSLPDKLHYVVPKSYVNKLLEDSLYRGIRKEE
jgi:hypothetical protein